jgi:C4-type Zn-finger protein
MDDQLNGRKVACPKCGTPMEYWVEIELESSGARRIKYYYKCPRCGYRLQDAIIAVKREDGKLVVEREEYRVVARAAVGRKPPK